MSNPGPIERTADPIDIAVNIYATGDPTAPDWNPVPSARSAARRNMRAAIAAYLLAWADETPGGMWVSDALRTRAAELVGSRPATQGAPTPCD